ncbi:hypothetical protein [Streptomyces violascens]|uniref:Uncharacterized protein n=1 Tax=Streptomyces violascens TaxID=67381 RepID=A0ABQ3QUP0_9ACTN|nr:hypothetical protein [Streptomyces violascens]GGU05487.1 hypothetical protein GCM10010289_28020 [Streptomyces violascens]GHI40996.1 hypothetical protein Sviol_54040 [Streptomyces violascens]
MRDRSPAAPGPAAAIDEALRDQPEDRHRADALHSLVADPVEDYGDW